MVVSFRRDEAPQLALTALAAAWVAAILVVTVARRIAYPFDLEWMEGGILLHVARLREGLPIYVCPGPDFTPFLYPPLYPQVLAWIGAPSLVLARVLSVAGVLAAVSALVTGLRRSGVAWFIVLGGIASFLTCYDDSGGFFDVARCDGLALGLVAWALILGSRGGRVQALASAALLFLAFATKQSMALAGIPIVWSIARREGLRAALLTFFLPATLLGAAFTAWMVARTDGWFWVYVVRVPALHGLEASKLFPDPERRLVVALPLMAVAVAVALVLRLRRGAPRPGTGTESSSLVPGIATLVILSILMRAHRGGYYNVLLPGFWALAAAGALALSRLVGSFPSATTRWVVAFALSAQLVLGTWHPSLWVPSAEDRHAAESVVEALRSHPGTLFAPEFPTYARAVGRWPGTHLYALADLDRPGSPWRFAIEDLQSELRAGRWDLVLTSERSAVLLSALRGRYTPEVEFHFPDRVGNPRSGFPVRPAYLWVRSAP